MFHQSGAIRDFVFPLATIEQRPGESSAARILGSAFVIGNRGFALTAKHVLDGCDGKPILGMFVSSAGGWLGIDITTRESHSTEDVAVVRLRGDGWKSFFRLSNSYENASCRYTLWGYPEDTYYELAVVGKAVPRPDLVYNEGYVRRRVNHEVLTLTGTSFFELSEVAGAGASGAPICKVTQSLFKALQPIWDVIGIYAGEKTNDRATSVSYAVREDAFRDWRPEILGTSILEESQQVTPNP
jgi:hypothetical protein